MISKKFLYIWLFFFALSFSTTGCLAYSDSITLLAVRTENNTYQGTVAEMTLKLTEGTGNTYFDISSLPQLDTQISIKFAKEIACNYLKEKVDCNKYDFFYSIRTDSSMISGPSAGAATAALTVASLMHVPINKSQSMTGTINSAGYIGGVGGVVEKIDAASKDNISLVLIPYEESNVSNATIKVISIYSLDQALFYLTGGELGSLNTQFDIDEGDLVLEYNRKMKKVSDLLCNRTEHLRSISGLKDTQNYNESKKAVEDKLYYSAASFCFRANVEYQADLLNSTNIDKPEELQKLRGLYDYEMADISDDKIGNLNNLQIALIIKDRLTDLNDSLRNIAESLENDSNLSNANFAYPRERLFTINAWKVFLTEDDENVNFSTELTNLCSDKKSELKSRIDYINYMVPGFASYLGFDDKLRELDETEDSLQCINLASFLKSRSDVVLSVSGINDTKSLYPIKQYFALKTIKQNLDKGIIPILGYSYYEYAKSLYEANSTTEALIYLEYSIEMNSITDYFDNKTKPTVNFDFSIGFLMICVGVILIIIALLRTVRRPKQNRAIPKRQGRPNFKHLKKRIRKL